MFGNSLGRASSSSCIIVSCIKNIANAFNHFFTNIATKLDSTLPPAQHDPLQFLNGDFPNDMQLPFITLNDIFTVIKSIPDKKCNLDDFSPRIIKENAHLIAQPLRLIYNQSLESGIFPSKLKVARVIPIYKKGAKSDMNNYRPISLINIFSKLFEKLVKKYLTKYMIENNVLNPRQYGFQRGKSTQDALIQFSKMLYSEIEKSNTVLSIFIDFSKAFDTVPHEILLKKLEFYGIRGSINKWFASYLSNRSQKTYISGSLSSMDKIKLGVPQGSVLGPILFLLFINDLPNISTLFHTILFADDATLSLVGLNPSTLISLANTELSKFYFWCLANRLSVNIIKTNFMLFGNSRRPNLLPPLLMKSLYTYETINEVTETKFLGIFYDNKLSFKPQINNLTQRLSRTCALLYRIKDLVPTFVLKNIYHAHVGSLLNYCNIIWANIPETTLNPLKLILKRVIRNIARSEFLAHTKPLFKRLKILDLDNLRKLSLGQYFYRSRNVNEMPLLRNHNYLTRHRHILRLPQHRLTRTQQSFVVQAPLIWNEIITNYPPHIKDATTLRAFKRRLKNYLLDQ